MNTNISTSDTLDLAADHILLNGWTQHQGWAATDDYPYSGVGNDPSGNLCLEGGIMAASGIRLGDNRGDALERLYECPAYSAVAEYLDVHSAFSWNDRKGRTQEEVIAVLRACAAVERAKEAVYADDDQPLPVEVAA